MRDIWLMTCGHASNTCAPDGTPACVLCGCNTVDHKIENETDGLENRTARCAWCGKIRPSRWDLPFFKYTADSKKNDEYYCGCGGWD